MELVTFVVSRDDVLEQHPTAVGIVCDTCELEYSLEDYETLKDNSKLVYFTFQPPKEKEPMLLCHDCFFKKIKKISKGEKEVKMRVFKGDDEILMHFTPEEMLPEDYDDDSDDSYLGLF